MNRIEFIIATAIVLLLAFAMGWFTYWLMHRFTRVAGGDMGEMDRLAQSLHEAEEIRDQAIIYLESREAELLNQIAQGEAELRAAMEGLRDARLEAEEMRAYIERSASYWEDGLHSLKDCPNVIDIRNVGLIGAVELASIPGEPTKRAFNAFLKAYEKGLLIRTTGDIIALSPPLIIEKQEIDELFGKLREVLQNNI